MIGVETLQCEHLPLTVYTGDTDSPLPAGSFYRVSDHVLDLQGVHPLTDSITSRAVSVEFPDTQSADNMYRAAFTQLQAGKGLELACTIATGVTQRFEAPMSAIRRVGDARIDMIIYVHPDSVLNNHQNLQAVG